MTGRETTRPELQPRELDGPAERRQAEDLQLAVWQDGEREVLPGDTLRAVQYVGGLVAGVMDGPTLLGLVVGFPTRLPGVQHSHLLAVHPAARGRGLAALLKLFQREWCLERGIHTVEWTYDPLLAVNAQLNIGRLGATAHVYLDDFYGEMGGINSGLPSDRLLAEWPLRGVRPGGGGQARQCVPVNSPQDGRPLGIVADQSQGALLRLHIPADLAALRLDDPAKAMAWRLHTRALFHALFDQGYRVAGFEHGARPAYLLSARTEAG